MAADTPIGPWRAPPFSKSLLAPGSVPTEIRDPGLFKDDDGACSIVFGNWRFYIARLNEDMISLAETRRLIAINQPEGPYGKGKTDDKPNLHQRAGIYYLSWGCYYGVSDSIYGSYDCRGSLILPDRITPALHYHGNHGIDYDRHGSFFEWRGPWYFICNKMGLTQNTAFRDSSISDVNYLPNGNIDPV